jgi:hypothetical protein
VVKVGFIVEGKTERKIVESAAFRELLSNNHLSLVSPVINADGNGNLLPKKLKESITVLQSNGAEKIFIVTDLDEDACITKTHERIGASANTIVIIAVKQIEAWFLADSFTMSTLLREDFSYEWPEKENAPFEKLKSLFLDKTNRGVGTKDTFTARMLKYGFSIQRAAAHPNCPSATYFLNKLKQTAPPPAAADRPDGEVTKQLPHRGGGLNFLL